MGRPTSPPSDGEGLRCWEDAGAVLFGIKVQPGARKDTILGLWNLRLRLSVHAPPEKGRANEAVTRLLAETLRLPHRQVAIVFGEGSREKTVRVRGLSKAEVGRRIGALLR